jgi:hypothetical protein
LEASYREGPPMDAKQVSAPSALPHSSARQLRDDGGGERNCFYCLAGWVFLGYLDHVSEEVTEAIRCRQCGDNAS